MTKSERRELGLRLWELRGRAGLSIPQVAEKTGIGMTTLRYWEQGSHEPSVGGLLMLAKLYGVSLDYIVTGGRNNARG